MRQVNGTKGNQRGSALWGKPKGESRSSALWGKPGRGFLAAVLVAALCVPVAATAGGQGRTLQEHHALVPASLMQDAQDHPTKVFPVIVQGTDETSQVASAVGNSRKAKPGSAKGLQKRFKSVNGVAADLTGAQIVDLAKRPGILAITPDSRIRLSVANGGFSSTQDWVPGAGVPDVWSAGLKPPAIAVVDSGVQACRADFDWCSAAARVVKQVSLTSLAPNSAGDGRGHGTLVAGLAAGSRDGSAGVAPTAPIVSIDVMDDNGMAMTSDVIAAADWILANKAKYNIRVANFSLQSTAPGSFMYDPLDQAVEKLWFNGVVVVAAVGNYGVDGQPTTVAYAPGNDPFVISVGAADLNGTPGNRTDDFAAPWSAYGYTLDGFAKPDIGAPGRYVVGPVPATSTMALEHPERLTTSNSMWMSGTSFAAPVVAGAAAQLLAKYPNWTPDQVKGALMLAARPTAAGTALGVGLVNVRGAFVADYASLPGGTPPNPNAALSGFVGPDGTGGVAFDSASWSSAAAANASWNSASWAQASWAQASWASASWAQASWAQASWASASWNAASWAQASWAAASWNAASWAQASWAE
ncbi:MAG TPA: S8 family serine peptidase [Gaiellaceae bacterium]